MKNVLVINPETRKEVLTDMADGHYGQIVEFKAKKGSVEVTKSPVRDLLTKALSEVPLSGSSSLNFISSACQDVSNEIRVSRDQLVEFMKTVHARALSIEEVALFLSLNNRDMGGDGKDGTIILLKGTSDAIFVRRDVHGLVIGTYSKFLQWMVDGYDFLCVKEDIITPYTYE